MHTHDYDCDVDSATDMCRSCGVHHGDPCPDCAGRGFHQATCPEFLADQEHPSESPRDARPEVATESVVCARPSPDGSAGSGPSCHSAGRVGTASPALPPTSAGDLILDARAHLAGALRLSSKADEPLLVQHIVAALALLRAVRT